MTTLSKRVQTDCVYSRFPGTVQNTLNSLLNISFYAYSKILHPKNTE